METPARYLPRHQMIRPDAGTGALRTLTSDDFPLIEIHSEPSLGGHWLFLHAAPDAPATTARFVGDGESLVLKCSQLLSSHYCRVTPPPPQKKTVVRVYTAGDHLTR